MTTHQSDLPVPHLAVIFSTQRREGDEDLYTETSAAMVDLVVHQPGYVSHESARDADGFGITVSYWEDHASIRNWQQNVEHLAAQRMGVEKFYASFTLRIATIETIRHFP